MDIRVWVGVGPVNGILLDIGTHKEKSMEVIDVRRRSIPPAYLKVYNKTTALINCKDEKHADFLFIKAAQRLLDINNWEHYSSKMPVAFSLTDSQANRTDEVAKEGLNIFINTPHLSNRKTAKRSYYWVTIDHLEFYEKTKDEVVLALRVHSARKPFIFPTKSARFFNSYADCTFLLSRDNLQITCSVVRKTDREVEKSNWLTRLKNFFIDLFNYLSFSRLQWKYLTRGILEYSNKEKTLLQKSKKKQMA